LAEETTLVRAMARGERARALLENELLAEPFVALPKAYFDGWRNSPPRDTEGRESLWQAAQIVGLVRNHLEAVIANGGLAKRELDEIARLGERRSLFGR
jgi:hypothetical protein